jgi:hypothetical protein
MDWFLLIYQMIKTIRQLPMQIFPETGLDRRCCGGSQTGLDQRCRGRIAKCKMPISSEIGIRMIKDNMD